MPRLKTCTEWDVTKGDLCGKPAVKKVTRRGGGLVHRCREHG